MLTQISNVSTAESKLVNAMSAYEQSKLNLDVVTGRLLDTLGISIGDAESGNVTHMPHAPYAVRGNDVITQPVPQFQPQQTGVTPQPRGNLRSCLEWKQMTFTKNKKYQETR